MLKKVMIYAATFLFSVSAMAQEQPISGVFTSYIKIGGKGIGMDKCYYGMNIIDNDGNRSYILDKIESDNHGRPVYRKLSSGHMRWILRSDIINAVNNIGAILKKQAHSGEFKEFANTYEGVINNITSKFIGVSSYSGKIFTCDAQKCSYKDVSAYKIFKRDDSGDISNDPIREDDYLRFDSALNEALRAKNENMVLSLLYRMKSHKDGRYLAFESPPNTYEYGLIRCDFNTKLIKEFIESGELPSMSRKEYEERFIFKGDAERAKWIELAKKNIK